MCIRDVVRILYLFFSFYFRYIISLVYWSSGHLTYIVLIFGLYIYIDVCYFIYLSMCCFFSFFIHMFLIYCMQFIISISH